VAATHTSRQSGCRTHTDGVQSPGCRVSTASSGTGPGAQATWRPARRLPSRTSAITGRSRSARAAPACSAVTSPQNCSDATVPCCSGHSHALRGKRAGPFGLFTCPVLWGVACVKELTSQSHGCSLTHCQQQSSRWEHCISASPDQAKISSERQLRNDCIVIRATLSCDSIRCDAVLASQSAACNAAHSSTVCSRPAHSDRLPAAARQEAVRAPAWYTPKRWCLPRAYDAVHAGRAPAHIDSVVDRAIAAACGMARGSWLPAASLPLAVLAVAVAALAAHSRFIVKKPTRTVLSGNTFEDTRNKTGNRYLWALIHQHYLQCHPHRAGCGSVSVSAKSCKPCWRTDILSWCHLSGSTMLS
jgi:hypothetical protein